MPKMRTSLLITAFLLVSAQFVSGQTGDAAPIVRVRDPFGGAIVGATVEAFAANGKRRAWVTDAGGNARLRDLGAGVYRIIVKAPGFKDYLADGIQLTGGTSRSIDVELEIAPIESEINVDETETVDPQNAGALVVLGEREINSLPDDQAELEKAIQRLGEAVAGEQLPITVDGVQGGKIPPKQAIQQIRVNQNVFSAQYDGPWGGGIEIFTRSTADRLRGYASFSFADSRMNAADPFLGRRAPYQSRNYFLNFYGPLISKKANFMVYGSRSENDSSSIINAVVLDPLLRPIEYKEDFASPSRSEGVTTVINADPDPKNKLYFFHNFAASRSEGQNTGGFSLESRANSGRFQSHWIQFSHTYLASPDVVNQTRIVTNYSDSKSFGGSDEPGLNVQESFYGGGSQQTIRNRNFRAEISNDTTWQRGPHSLGFGFRFRGEHIIQFSEVNFGGTHAFAGSLAPVLDSANNPVYNDDGTIMRAQIGSLESYRRTLLLRQLGFSPQRIRELGGGAANLTISGGDPRIAISQYDAGFYVQNSHKISETVAFSWGLRYEDQSNIDSNLNLAPRFGFIWAPKAKDKQPALWTLPRISVGYGLFYSRFGVNNTLNARLASDPDRLQYFVTEPGFLDLFPAVPSIDLLQKFALPRTLRLIHPELETPYQSLLTVTATKKMPMGFTVTATYSKGKTYRSTFTKNINAPLAGTYDPLDPTSAVRPYENARNIYESGSTGFSTSERFSLNLNFPQSQKLYANLRYSYGRAAGSVVSGSGSGYDPYDFTLDVGPTAWDGVHSAGGYFYYSLPRRVSIGGDLSINSGTRFNITTGRDSNGDGYYSERPSYATDPAKPGVIQTPYGLLDPNPEPGDQIIPRNIGRGPTTLVFNSSISKAFAFNGDKEKKIQPKQTLTFTLRVNNVLNFINKGNPVGNMASPNFLQILSPYTDGGIVTINGARQENFPGRSMSLNVSVGF
jgi:hypothetical protein